MTMSDEGVPRTAEGASTGGGAELAEG